MLGTSGRTSGLASSIHATRLLVVPRSIPTALSLSNSIWNMGLGYKIRYILSAVQEASNSRERFAIVSAIPLAERSLQFGVDFAPHDFEPQPRRFQLFYVRFFERHI